MAASIAGAAMLISMPAAAQTGAVIAKNHPAMVERMASSGKVEAARPLEMSVTLSLRNRDQLEQLIADQQNPASPEYHHFLTPDEFAARFGPTDYDAVRDWLTSEGFKVTGINPATRAIHFTGTAGQAEQTFNVDIGSFGGASFGNTTDPRIPARFEGLFDYLH